MGIRRRAVVAAAAAAVVALAASMLPIPAAWAAPANDDYANAQRIEGVCGTFHADLAGATVESGEPQGSGGAHSIWFLWRAPATAALVFTDGDGVSTWLTYLVDEGASLDTATSTSGSGGASFAVQAGHWYHIGIWSQSENSTDVHWELFPRPANDDFADARPLTGPSGHVTGDTTYAATHEAGEPYADASYASLERSVWYRWTAPADGTYEFDGSDSGFPVRVFVYTGDAVDHLTRVTGGVRDAGIGAEAGRVYSIAVTGDSGAVGHVDLRWVPLDYAPPNDLLGHARVLSGASGEVEESPTWATLQADELDKAKTFPGPTVWYRWTAPASGRVRLDVVAYNGDAQPGVFTGSTMATLTAVPLGHDQNGSYPQPWTFSATAGTSYAIAVGGWGVARLAWAQGPPANDDIANAAVMSGTVGTLPGDLRFATKDPNLAADGYMHGPTVWYRWTAPATGSVIFHVERPGNDSELGVFTGSSPSSLAQLKSSTTPFNQDETGSTVQVAVSAKAGTTYWVAVAGAPAPLVFGWRQGALDTTPPQGVVTSPASGSVVKGVVNITATASDDIAVDRVEFFVRDGDYGTYFTASVDRTPPYQATLDTRMFDNDQVLVWAVAVDTSGNVWWPGIGREVRWDSANTPPTTKITGPRPLWRTPSTSAHFGLESYYSGPTCSLDGAAFSACASATSQDYSALADGPHTFVLQNTGPSGLTDPTPATAQWVVDTTPPTATPPASSLMPGVVTDAGVPVRLAWSGSDPDDGTIGAYSLTRSTSPAAQPAPVRLWPPDATAAATHVRAGADPAFAVQPVDCLGLVGAAQESAPVEVRARQDGSPDISYSGPWSKTAAADLWGGSARSTSTPGASAGVSVQGRYVTAVVTKGPGLGAADLLVDGVRVATLDLSAPARTTRVVAAPRALDPSVPHTVTLVDSRGTVELDGFALLL